MGGSTRFELTSGSPEGSAFAATYPNGQRSNYATANLDRSRSFREVMENRTLNSGPGSARGSNTLSANMPSLSQCLMLEPITLGDQKFTRAGELRRALGVNFGNTTEDHSFGAVHSKAPPVAIDELKRFKASIFDACNNARERVKTLNDSIVKLDEYYEALDPRKKRRSEFISSERSGGTNLLKMGAQFHQNRPEVVTRRLEERTKNAINKRVRTSVAESEGRNSTLSRQAGLTDKDRDVLRDGNGVQVEERVRGLPAGGEGWDKKMKRKRSVGIVVTRAMDGDREVKRAMLQKLNSDPRPRSSDAHGFRSESSNGINGINKLDGASQPTSSNSRVIPRNEMDNVSLPRDRTAGLEKERFVAKANNKLNIREDSKAGSPSPVTKGKALRASRTGSSSGPGSGSGVVTTSSPSFPHTTEVLDGWEQPPSLNKIQSMGGANSRKRPLPTGSSSPPMAQWAGQRPHKISRTRRANLVSPISNTAEAQISSEGFPAPDIGGRLNSNEPNGSLLARGASNNTHQFKMKLENVASLARLSESEESGAGESKFKEKGMDNVELDVRGTNAVRKVGTFSLPTKKNKLLMKEEIGDGLRRQGRSGRSSSLSRVSVPPIRENSEDTATAKPLQSTRPGSDKNERLGRPTSKKMSERKSFTRPGHVLNSGSSYFTAGESDDDHEELMTAAKSAHNASYHACSGSFWKKMEPIFASVSSEDSAFLKKQLSAAEELDESLGHIFAADLYVQGELLSKEDSSSQPLASGEKQGSQLNGIGSNESDKAAGLVDQPQGNNTLCGRIDAGGQFDKVTPLYQRLLSAFIEEDVVEEFDHSSESRNNSFQYANGDSPFGNHIDVESKDGERMESDIESELDPRTQKCSFDFYPCNGSTASNRFRSTSIHKNSYHDELWQADDGLVQLEAGVVTELVQTNLEGTQDAQTNISGLSSIGCQYQQMNLDDKILLELQSIGLYPETVPNLAEGEEDEISKEIVELKKGLYKQVVKKKNYLTKIDKAVQKEKEIEARDLEQVAMNKLVEMAYKKQMARRRSSSKGGVNKVSRQVAMAFAKRTLTRCQKFEDTGISCFSDPALRDALFSRNDAIIVDVGGASTNMSAVASSCQPEAKASAAGACSSALEQNGPHIDKIDRGSSGTFQVHAHSSEQSFAKREPLNRGKKKEVLLDDVVGIAASRATSALGNSLLGGAKGKRSDSERDQNKDILSRNSAAKAGHPSSGNCRDERKTKTKSNQKTAELSTSGNGLLGRLAETTLSVFPSGRGSNETVTNDGVKVSGEMGLISPVNIPQDSSKMTEEPIDVTNLQLQELDSVGIGESNDLGANQDLSSWLDLDEDSLQDHDSMGLEIPMDDLSELNMLI